VNLTLDPALLSSYFPFWNQLTSTQQDLLVKNTRQLHFPAGKILHNGSSDCIGLLLVISGELRAYTISDEGKELTLYRLFEHDMCLFSAACILNSVSFEITVSTVEESSILHVPADLYKQLMRENAAVANYTNELMASRFSDVMWLMDQIMNKKLGARVAAFLIEESTLHHSVTLHMTHEQIANHLGSAREVITRMLKYFQREGLLQLSRGVIHIKNLSSLEEIAAPSLR
jgi:CRP/FNR family transcriptional regulator